jgi:predicted SAM-dependent methyltransferase
VLFRVHAVRLLQKWLGSQSRQSRATRLLRRQIESRDRIRLAIGSESHCTEDWIPAERDQIDLVNPASWSCFFQKSSVDAILAEHVWEHLSEQDGKTAARNCFQFLRPGGYLRVAVPDGFHPSQQCQELRRQGGSEIGSGGHGSLYNHHSFAESFLQVGFQVQLIEFFDQEGVFHSNHWDVSKGMVKRSLLFDERNIDQPFAYTSLVLDAVKPGAAAMGLESDRVGTNKMGTSGTQADSVGCKDGVVQHNFKREAA